MIYLKNLNYFYIVLRQSFKIIMEIYCYIMPYDRMKKLNLSFKFMCVPQQPIATSLME